MKAILLLPVALLIAGAAWAGWPEPLRVGDDGGGAGVADPLGAAAPPALGEPEPTAPQRLSGGAPGIAPSAATSVAAEADDHLGPLLSCDGPSLDGEDPEAHRLAAPPPAASLPLEVRLVDAETGRPSATATWALALEGAARPEDVSAPGTIAVKDARVARGIVITPGTSEIAWDAPHLDPPVSRFAERLAVTYPLRREVTACVAVETGEGRAPTGELGVEAWIAGRPVGVPWREVARVPADVAGSVRLEVPGIALLHGEPLSITVRETRGDDAFSVEWTGTLGHDGRTRVEVDLVLPTVPDRPLPFLGRGGHRNLRCGCGCRRAREPEETGGLLLEVARLDGRPAVGAEVRVRSKDDGALASSRRSLDVHGRAAFAGLEAGVWTVDLREVGLVPTSREVRVRAGEATRLRLEEAPGASLHVEVLDAEGYVLPFATLEVAETPSGVEWVDLDRGVERFDGFTDETGRRTLDRLGAGPTRLRARYGSRRAEETVEVPPSGSLAVRLIVR